jgi:hypothetical protein
MGERTRLEYRNQLDSPCPLVGTYKIGANQSTRTVRNANMLAGILSSRGLDVKEDMLSDMVNPQTHDAL